jgi:hypothetical protein
MRKTIRLAIASLLVALVGCGGGDTGPTSGATTGPDGGTMYSLPNGRGFVEIKSEVNAPSRNARGKTRSSTIVATFYQADRHTPLSPAPTDVSVKLGVDGSAPAIALTADPGDSKSPSRFASAPGDHPEAPRGTLLAKVDGAAVEVPFSTR